MSPWLVALLTAAGTAAVLALLYLYVLPSKNSATATTTAAKLETPGRTTSRPAHPLAKHLEITGLRITEDARQRVKIQFVMVNHSGADLPDLELRVALKGSSPQPIFEFPFKLGSIGPYEVRDCSAVLKTNLRPYELPDWQLIKPEFQVVSEP
jgi:hypothetical protein